jgi:tRNA(fMet)-specific endonuclease VapC
MSGRYLLDTSVAVRVLNREVDLEARRDQGLEAFLCVTVVGELLFGAAKSAKPGENRSRVERLIEACPQVSHDVDTARRYAALKVVFRRKGRPIPENDIWVAASALQHGLILVARDQHFDHVDGLDRESW